MSGTKNMAWLLRLASGQGKRLLLSAILNLCGCILGLVPFYVAYRLVELAALANGQSGLAGSAPRLLAACAGALLLKNACLAASTSLSHKCAYRILHDLRAALVRHIGGLPMGFFNRNGSARIKKVLCEDIELLEIFLAHNIPELLGAALSALTIAAVLFTADWRMALATLALPVLGVAVQSSMFFRGRGPVRDWYAAQEEMNAVMLQYLQGIPVIKSFNRGIDSFGRYADAVEQCRAIEDLANRRWYFALSVFQAALPNALLVILPVGLYLHLEAGLPLQSLTFFLLVGPALSTPLTILTMFWHCLEKIMEAQDRISSIFAQRPLAEPKRPEPAGEPLRGEKVCFEYERDMPVLREVDFVAPPGRLLALVGPSGAGKTTLARLIPRFWDVTGGALRLGPADIRAIGTERLMGHMTFVFQNVQLFNMTVAENLRLARPDAGDDDLERVSRAARCHDFILRLPQGYGTRIGERGCRLSGGERQRLSIARAMLKDASVVILDEATAFVDPENEMLIQEAIDELARDKTLVVIAHRLSTIVCADEILVLDKGVVSARGRHEELLRTSGLYRNMWQAHTRVGRLPREVTP